MSKPRLAPDSGIAIAAILFVIALLALIGGAIAAGGGGFTIASVTDRVSADMETQANLIRSKINECNLMYGTNANYDGYPSSDATNGTAVSALTCTGDPSGQQEPVERPTPSQFPATNQWLWSVDVHQYKRYGTWWFGGRRPLHMDFPDPEQPKHEHRSCVRTFKSSE